MGKNWASVKDDIERLYHIEKKPLSEVMRLIRGRHGFHASERSYRTRLQKWGYLKYNTETNPRVRGSTGTTAKTVRKRNLQSLGQSSGSSSAEIANSQTTFEPSTTAFALNNINPWDFDAGPPIDSSNTNFLDIGYNPAIRSSSVVAPQYSLGLNEVDSEGKTALHRAAINENTEQLQSLLERGAAVHIKDNIGNEALHYAAALKDLESVKLLIRYGANLNTAGHCGRSPLHLVLPEQKLVDFLLHEGASTLSQDANGDTALHFAISMQTWGTAPAYASDSEYSAPLIDCLIQDNHAVNVTNRNGITPFHRLLAQKYAERSLIFKYITKFLNLGASTELSPPNNTSPLALFLANGGEDWRKSLYITYSAAHKALRSFIEHGADPMTQLPTGEPLIVYSISQLRNNSWSRDYSFLELLCKYVDTGPNMPNGNTTLHELALICGAWATPSKMPVNESMKILLNRGAMPNQKNSEGQTPLSLLFSGYIAKLKQVICCASTLLAHGADPTILDSEGNSPLIKAAKKLNSDELKSLLIAYMARDCRSSVAQSPPAESSDDRPRLVWEEWDLALQEEIWADAKGHILVPSSNEWPKSIDEKLRDAAFKVLAEKHLDLAKRLFEGDPDKKEKRRVLVSTILRDCRSRNWGPEWKFVDYLLTLC